MFEVIAAIFCLGSLAWLCGVNGDNPVNRLRNKPSYFEERQAENNSDL